MPRVCTLVLLIIYVLKTDYGHACIMVHLEHSLICMLAYIRNCYPLDSRVCMSFMTEVRTKVVITYTIMFKEYGC